MGMGHTRESSNEINLLHLHVMPIEVQYSAGGIQTWTQVPRSVRSVRTSSSPSDSALFSFLLSSLLLWPTLNRHSRYLPAVVWTMKASTYRREKAKK